MDKVIVITTLNPPKEELCKYIKIPGWKMVCVGDLKTPPDWNAEGIDYLSPQRQEQLFPVFARVFPWNMYARKNLGYLYAIKNGAQIIADTDDDMIPDKNYPPDLSIKKTLPVLSGKKFINVYPYFFEKPMDHPFWIRGFPLEDIKNTDPVKEKKGTVQIYIQNSVLDKNSDFDAVYRFIYPEWLDLKKSGEYALDKGCYAPFNTQSTFFHPMVYPLLYLPATTGFRGEDITRSYIAQRILWEIDGRLCFSHPVQHTLDRNPNDNLHNFRLEIPVILGMKLLVNILDSLSLPKEPTEALLKVYRALVKQGFLPKEELPIVSAWVCEVEQLLSNTKPTEDQKIPFKGLIDYTNGELKNPWKLWDK